MSRKFETKQKILDMLKSRHMTLTELSQRLGLAPSTVSQHIKELLISGAIREIDNPFIKKWKYYEPNVELNLAKASAPIHPGSSKAMPIAAIVILSVAILFALINFTPQSVPLGSTIISVSDAPPLYNITGVYLTFSNVSIHSSSNGKWYALPIKAHTFNLVTMQNVSKVISVAQLPSGTYDEIVLDVSNAIATVNGTNQSIILPSSRLRIFENYSISNATTNWLNMDFNLSRSLHITGNGRIIMLPVINMMYANSQRLMYYRHSYMILHHKISTKYTSTFGMRANGTFGQGFVMPMASRIIIAPNGSIKITTGNGMPIVISSKHNIAIVRATITNSTEMNITIGIANGTTGVFTKSTLPVKCMITHNYAICNANGANQNIEGIIRNLSVIIQNASNSRAISINSSNATVKVAVSEEMQRVKNIYPQASNSAFGCSTSSECALVPTGPCLNGLPDEYSCINSASLTAYMSYYDQFRAHAHAFCPMFVVNSHISCSCISNYCVETSSPMPAPMPQ